MKRILILKSQFSSAHKYENPKFSEAENKKVFGRCFTDHGHGHNYKIEIGFLIPPKASDENVVNINLQLQNELKLLTEKLDHEHLNFVIPEFKEIIPTTENILIYFEKKIANLKLKYSLAFIKLFEMENLWSEKYYVTK